MIVLEDGWQSNRRPVNGVELHVVEARPATGPLLMLLPGILVSLASSDYTARPGRLPGGAGYARLNTSDAPQHVSAYQLDTLVSDVVALADSYGAERFRLVGHDWGGIVAWGVGASHPDRLERLVIMDAPHPDLWARQALKHPTQALRSTCVALFQLPALPEAALGALDFAGLLTMVEGSARKDALKPGEIEEDIEVWGHPGSLTSMMNYYRALREHDRTELPARIVPLTLVLWARMMSFWSIMWRRPRWNCAIRDDC